MGCTFSMQARVRESCKETRVGLKGHVDGMPLQRIGGRGASRCEAPKSPMTKNGPCVADACACRAGAPFVARAVLAVRILVVVGTAQATHRVCNLGCGAVARHDASVVFELDRGVGAEVAPAVAVVVDVVEL